MRIPNPFSLILFFLLSQFALYSADDDEFKPQLNCPLFDCGSLGKVSYPFSNITNSGCGLYINCTGVAPVIEFGVGQSYVVKKVFSHNNTTIVHDRNFQKMLNSKDCNHLNNISLPIPYQVSFELQNPNLTLFKCGKNNPSPDFRSFHFDGFKTYNGCGNFDIYYGYKQQPSHPLPDEYPPLCSVVQLPLSVPTGPTPKLLNADPFTLLVADFHFAWHVLYDKSTDASVDKKSEETDHNNKPRKIAIGVGAGVGGFILACLAFYFFYLRRRKNRRSISSNLISQNISPDSSLKPDPENGSAYFKTPIFSYKELEEATNNFDSNRELGDGGFGTVYRGELRDGRVVAVKRLYENNFKRVEQFMNEVNILSHLRHENLVTLYGCTSRHSRELLLVYEYVPNGTVADHIHGELAKAGLATWPVRMNIAIESAGALKYLHVSEIIHRDVKTNNILLDKSFHVKVADFGLSRLFPTDVTHVSTAPQGTPGYVDPEYYQCYQLTNKSDVYSFGVVLIELISSKPAVDITRHRHDINLANMAINKIQNHSLSDLVDPHLGFETDTRARRMITLVAELAFRCLQQDRDMRPCMDEVYEVLKGIKDEEYNVGKAEEVIDIRSDRDVVGLLKNNTAPFSPVSVTDKWGSVASTPNTSS